MGKRPDSLPWEKEDAAAESTALPGERSPMRAPGSARATTP